MPDGDPIFWLLLLQLFLIVINAIFACAEIAVISMNDNKLARLGTAGDKRALRLLKLTDQPARFLATIQVGITLAGFLGSAFAADNFSDKLVNWFVASGLTISVSTLNTISVIIITLVLSYFTLVLGELVPKRVAMRHAEKLALAMSGLVFFIAKVFAPVVWLLTVSTNGLLRLMGIDPYADDEEVTEEEIRMMVDVGSERGAINLNEKEMIHNIFEFNNKNAEDVMTHRTEVSFLWFDEDDEQWEEVINASRHTIYPICDESIDNIIGILNTKDYFRIKERSRENIMKYAVKPAYFVPETVRTDVLFHNMKKNRNHFSIVIDEYGGTNGIITMSDLLEELVGDLDDNNSIPEEPPLIEQIDANTWRIHGAAPLNMVAEQLGVLLPEDDYDTFSGFVFGLLGYIPEEGSKPELEEYGLTIKVASIKYHHLEKAIVAVEPKTNNNQP
ncbi:MAG: hemolysin family protein [Syntrophomonas sp.]|nr:hemolysin family protein [Syntrophomonas sp.]